MGAVQPWAQGEQQRAGSGASGGRPGGCASPGAPQQARGQRMRPPQPPTPPILPHTAHTHHPTPAPPAHIMSGSPSSCSVHPSQLKTAIFCPPMVTRSPRSSAVPNTSAWPDTSWRQGEGEGEGEGRRPRRQRDSRAAGPGSCLQTSPFACQHLTWGMPSSAQQSCRRRRRRCDTPHAGPRPGWTRRLPLGSIASPAGAPACPSPPPCAAHVAAAGRSTRA